MKLVKIDGKTYDLVRILSSDTVIVKELWSHKEYMMMLDKELEYVK